MATILKQVLLHIQTKFPGASTGIPVDADCIQNVSGGDSISVLGGDTFLNGVITVNL